jgi:hypothetical protein
VRLAVAEALGKIKDVRAVEALLDALRDRDSDVRARLPRRSARSGTRGRRGARPAPQGREDRACARRPPRPSRRSTQLVEVGRGARRRSRLPQDAQDTPTPSCNRPAAETLGIIGDPVAVDSARAAAQRQERGLRQGGRRRRLASPRPAGGRAAASTPSRPRRRGARRRGRQALGRNRRPSRRRAARRGADETCSPTRSRSPSARSSRGAAWRGPRARPSALKERSGAARRPADTLVQIGKAAVRPLSRRSATRTMACAPRRRSALERLSWAPASAEQRVARGRRGRTSRPGRGEGAAAVDVLVGLCDGRIARRARGAVEALGRSRTRA